MSIETFSEITEIEKCTCIEKVFKEYWPFATECTPIEKRVLITKFNSQLVTLVHDDNCCFRINVEKLVNANADRFRQSTHEEILAVLARQKEQQLSKNNKLVNIHSIAKGILKLDKWNTQFYKMYYPSFYCLGQEIKAYEKLLLDPKAPIITKKFSGFEWATIFYYLETSSMTSNNSSVNGRIADFIVKHEVTTTLGVIQSKKSAASKQINDFSNYPIGKLSRILSFFKENYPKVATKIEQDIELLKIEKSIRE